MSMYYIFYSLQIVQLSQYCFFFHSYIGIGSRIVTMQSNMLFLYAIVIFMFYKVVAKGLELDAALGGFRRRYIVRCCHVCLSDCRAASGRAAWRRPSYNILRLTFTQDSTITIRGSDNVKSSKQKHNLLTGSQPILFV